MTSESNYWKSLKENPVSRDTAKDRLIAVLLGPHGQMTDVKQARSGSGTGRSDGPRAHQGLNGPAEIPGADSEW